MSQYYKFENHTKAKVDHPPYRVKVTDLILRMSNEKKITRKRNLAIGIAAISVATFFSIVLTI